MPASAPNFDVFVKGAEIPDGHIVSFVIERDLNQPDMAAIVIDNQDDAYSSKWSVGDPIEIKVGDDKKQIFKGQVIGFEGVYSGGKKTTLLPRAIKGTHLLAAQRKPMTHTEKEGKDILSAICSENGLTLDYSGPSIMYKHVYQHNQTDLEFLRTRAARIGCHVWCVDTTVYVKEPTFDKMGSLELSVDEGGLLRTFMPRISSASGVKKVKVKGWDPEKKELNVGRQAALPTKLGSTTAVAASGDLAPEETFTVDHPIWSVEEAKALAKARVRELNLTFMTAEAECGGNADADLGEVIKVTANKKNGADPFNGKYYIVGITHRQSQAKSKAPGAANEGGYITTYRLARDAQKA